MIAGTHSGSGKTTLTCALMKALKKRGLNISSFKCGPDYIDPMFHREVIGTESYNLDSFFCNSDTVKYLLDENSKNSDISVIEGVMGFYDGNEGSAYSLSEITETPVIIVIDCKGMGESIGAVMKGFLEYKKPNRIAGFIFNRLSERLKEFAENLCHELGTEYFGFMPKHDIQLASRHLGLVTASEISDIQNKIENLSELAEKNLLIDKIIGFSECEKLKYTFPKINPINSKTKPIVAVARDKAFCFIYSENIALLEKMGCEIKYFSPLEDEKLPDNINGLILNGGYPELYAEKLSQNKTMLESVNNTVNTKIPTIAECGGFMYLHDLIESENGEEFKMVGLIHGKAYKTNRLQRFGYSHIKSENESLLFRKSDYIAVHEFHYWDSTNCGEDLISEKKDGRKWNFGHCSKSMYAGFPHLYFYSDVRIAERFVKACAEYGEENGKNKKY